jgi:septal ring factor EnvC (AmiA/AmiB activator)
MKLEGLEAMTRKQEDDMERNLSQTEQKHAATKQEHDNLQKMLLDLQAGIEHLCAKLNEIKLQNTSMNNPPIQNIETIT